MERVNGHFKDEFGGRHVRVRAHGKVFCHLMFGTLAPTVDQAAASHALSGPPSKDRVGRWCRDGRVVPTSARNRMETQSIGIANENYWCWPLLTTGRTRCPTKRYPITPNFAECSVVIV